MKNYIFFLMLFVSISIFSSQTKTNLWEERTCTLSSETDKPHDIKEQADESELKSYQMFTKMMKKRKNLEILPSIKIPRTRVYNRDGDYYGPFGYFDRYRTASTWDIDPFHTTETGIAKWGTKKKNEKESMKAEKKENECFVREPVDI